MPARVRLSGVLGAAVVFASWASVFAQAPPQGPGRGGGAPPSARAQAAVDITGNWVTIVNEDWRYRMVTPAKGDYASVPISAEGRRVADMWDPAKDEAAGNQCKAYGAAGVMRLPNRLNVSWQDDNTLKIDIDAGQQTRLLRFGAGLKPSGEPSWQGFSIATWEMPGGGGRGGRGGGAPAPQADAPADAPAGRGGGGANAGRGAAPAAAPAAAAAPPAGGAGGRGNAAPARGSLKVVTTLMKAGYLRKNGVPYSENTVLTEYFDRHRSEGVEWMTITTVVEDPTNLTMPFITSTHFKREPDGSKFAPTPCSAK